MKVCATRIYCHSDARRWLGNKGCGEGGECSEAGSAEGTVVTGPLFCQG